jgi:hypothetical protein
MRVLVDRSFVRNQEPIREDARACCSAEFGSYGLKSKASISITGSTGKRKPLPNEYTATMLLSAMRRPPKAPMGAEAAKTLHPLVGKGSTAASAHSTSFRFRSRSCLEVAGPLQALQKVNR